MSDTFDFDPNLIIIDPRDCTGCDTGKISCRICENYYKIDPVTKKPNIPEPK